MKVSSLIQSLTLGLVEVGRNVAEITAQFIDERLQRMAFASMPVQYFLWTIGAHDEYPTSR